MDKPDLSALEAQIDELIRRCERLSNENQALRDQQGSLVAETRLSHREIGDRPHPCRGDDRAPSGHGDRHLSEEIVPVTIEILEKEYTIACPASERDGLVESAQMLSERLRQVRDGGKVLSTERMVIITALNLIHEFMQRQRDAVHQQQAQGEMQRAIEADIRRLREKLGNAIAAHG